VGPFWTSITIAVFKDICRQVVEEDGLTFDPEAVRGERIKEDQEYEGVRVHCEARLGQPRIDLQIDIGFGDAVTPRSVEVTFPALLKFPAPVLWAYPKQTVVAEKFQAMVMLGIANSRMKDFYDLWILAHIFEFDGPTLCQAIQATFCRRNTELPAKAPLALTPEFGADATKVKQWQAFIRKAKLDTGSASLEQVCEFLNGFLMPPTQAIVAAESFHKSWPQAGPWV
jgi:Nucleotidyl transferase AbiEii toxin, Type IV TA system